MTYDLQKWRRLLEEKDHEHYRFNVKKSPREINIEIIEKNTLKAPKGKRNEYGESGGLGHMQLLKRGDNEHWEVASVASPETSSGVGKELYLLALQLTYPSGLSPDSVGQSKPAKGLWNTFLKTHPDVTFEEKEEEVNASVDDPFKYVWKIDPNYKSKLDYGVERVEIEEPEEAEAEEDPWDPKTTSIDDLLAGIDDHPDPFAEAVRPVDIDKVSKVVIYNRNGKILLLKRADERNDWDLPGGHLQQGETHMEAAQRETKEETNLAISDPQYIQTHEHVEFFKCPCPKGEIKLDPNEHLDFRWINPRELNDYQIRKSLKDAIYAAISVVNEDFQQNVKKNYSKLKFKMIGQGKNTYNVGGKMEKPSYKRSKSAPPGFGGSLEEGND
jgi:8-oxo-dGTP diphosphatase